MQKYKKEYRVWFKKIGEWRKKSTEPTFNIIEAFTAKEAKAIFNKENPGYKATNAWEIV